MALPTECQTPGTQFRTHVSSLGIEVQVDFHRAIDLDADTAALIEANLHNAVELVLAPLFRTHLP